MAVFRRSKLSKIKEQLIGYDHRSDWIDDNSYVMVNELVEYQLYCLTVSELQSLAADKLIQEYYLMDYSDFKQKHDNAFGERQNE